ncbi:MAG: DNA primase [Gammaproteobacteria bacterium RBG_16_51_14]|nr:MAG: DNA primase [Gammaproteobacteria bacterium RBG_16_51_14]
MAGRIPQNFIDDLLARVDIIDIVDSYVPLRKAGRNHQALCPFHEEKTPSFTVNQAKQFYHCFGCGASGTAITFVMEYLHLGFIEAVEELASRAGLTVPREDGFVAKDSDNTTELYELMELVVRFYCKQLREHSQASAAVAYLKQRGITGEIAAQFEIGYAPPGWDNVIRALGGSDAALQRLARIGMLLKKDSGGYYDRFRERIMFPIRDQRGRVTGFGGRVLDDTKPKYLNSPETPIFHKGEELYGLYQARHTHKNSEQLYIVEGYMDVLALVQSGIHNAVATLGTAATQQHLEKLFRVTGQIVFCFDGDTAGEKAAWRALETALPLLRDGRQVHFIFLPEGHDPDTYVREKGRDAFEDKQAIVPLSDYLLNNLTSRTTLTTREGRATLIERSLPYLKQLHPGTLRKLLVNDLAALAQYDAGDIESAFQQNDKKTRPAVRRTRKQSRPESDSPIQLVIKYLVHHPELALLLSSAEPLALVDIKGVDFLLQLIELIRDKPQITTATIMETWRGTRYEKRLNEIAGSEDILAEIDDPESQFLDAMNKLAKRGDGPLNLLKKNPSPNDLTDSEKLALRNLHIGGKQSQNKN